MRILLLTQIVPYPPDSGPKIKTHNVLRYLAQRHEVHLISFVRNAGEEASASALRRYCASVTTVPLRRSKARDVRYLLKSLTSPLPFLILRDDSSAFREAVSRLLEKHRFDAVHADQLSMAQFAVDLPVPLRVLDEHNAVWTIVKRSAKSELSGPKRPVAEVEWRKLRRYEGQICRAFDRVTVVSEDDRRALAEAAGGQLRATVIPIAVDTREMSVLPRSADARDVASVATMYYPPNVEGVHWFATEVFPLVRREAPETTFYLVGSRPPEKIRGLARPDSGVEVTGYVADLEPILRKSATMVVPVKSGSGMRVKILEAFARGIPVVSTTIGVEGIEARAGEHLLVADSPAEFARAVLRVLGDEVLGRRLARAGRVLVEEMYDWRTALRALDDVYPTSYPRSVGEPIEDSPRSAELGSGKSAIG